MRIEQRNSPFVEEFTCPINPIFSNSLGAALEMKMAALRAIFYYFREAGSICSAVEIWKTINPWRMACAGSHRKG